MFCRDPRAPEKPTRRLTHPPGHDPAQVCRVHHQVHAGVLARGPGSQTRLQVHTHAPEADAEGNVSDTSR